MKNKNKTLWIVGAVIVGVILLIILYNSTPKSNAPTCNSPYILVGNSCCLDQNHNEICDNDETTNTNNNPTSNTPVNNQPQQKEISSNDLITFVKNTIEQNFPQSSGTFVKSQDIDDAKAEGHGCFTGFSYPCTSYFYPYDDAFSNKIYSHVYDFGKGDSPSLSKILSDQSSFGGVDKRTLQNGEVIVQEYNNPNVNPYTGQTTDYSRLFEVDVPCGDRYWIKLGFFKQDADFSGKINEKGGMLDSADKILEFCK